MKGVVIEQPNAPYKFVEDLEKPKPNADQILVKSIYTAINPVDTFMQSSGILVHSWPIVLGCDASGVVVEVGENAKRLFQVGDHVAGCTRLGSPGFMTEEEFFLMDAKLTLLNQKYTLQQGATLGVGVYTAALGIYDGLKIELPDSNAPSSTKEDWVVVLGGAGSVGQYAVQLAKLSGYKVVATCSTKTATLVKGLGADEIVDYRQSEDEQLQQIEKTTGGKFCRVFDSVAKSHELALKALDEKSTTKEKYFTTTNDWFEISHASVNINQIALGPIGRDEAQELNEKIARYIQVLNPLINSGKIQPNEYEVAAKGFENIAKAVEYQQKGTSAGVKVLVELGTVDA